MNNHQSMLDISKSIFLILIICYDASFVLGFTIPKSYSSSRTPLLITSLGDRHVRSGTDVLRQTTTENVKILKTKLCMRTEYMDDDEDRDFQEFAAKLERGDDIDDDDDDGMNDHNSHNGQIVGRKTGGVTLYDILQITPTSSRTEIKKKYFQLAKALHPDAARRNNGFDVNIKDNINRFTEVSAAYKILYDPVERKRYDRALQAETFKGNLENAAAKLSKQTAPIVKDLFENIAAPLFRKSSATTAAFIMAATEDLSLQAKDVLNNNQSTSLDLSRTVKTVMEATKQAGNRVDRSILIQKIQQLTLRSQEELRAARRIKKKLGLVTKTKLVAAIKLPNTPLSADEAQIVLESLNTTDSLSFFGSLLCRRTIHAEIEQMKIIETEFHEKVQLANSADQQYKDTERSLKEAEQMEQMALDDIERYTKALQAAKEQVSQARQARTEHNKLITNIVRARKGRNQDVEKVDATLHRKRELVRNALQKEESEIIKKEQMMEQQAIDIISKTTYTSNLSLLSGDGKAMTPTYVSTLTRNGKSNMDSNNDEAIMKKFTKLQRKEQNMKDEIERIEALVSRLQSRTAKLKIKADSLNKQQA